MPIYSMSHSSSCARRLKREHERVQQGAFQELKLFPLPATHTCKNWADSQIVLEAMNFYLASVQKRAWVGGCVCTWMFAPVLTCLLAHVCGQVGRTRAEVLVAVGQEGRQRVHPVGLLHHRHFVGLRRRHKDTRVNWVLHACKHEPLLHTTSGNGRRTMCSHLRRTWVQAATLHDWT